MAHLSFPSSRRQRALSFDLPLVPFLDLLLCCVMFLLVTALWNAPCAFDTQRLPRSGHFDPAQVHPALHLLVTIEHRGYTLLSTAGERVHLPGHDREALSKALQAFRQLHAERAQVSVSADDGIAYAQLVRVLDLVKDAGYHRVDVSPSHD